MKTSLITNTGLHSKPDLNQKSRLGLLAQQQKTSYALNANRYYKNNIYFTNASVSQPFISNRVSFGSNKLFSILPDLKQYDIKGAEEYYCGPVSAANGVIMLAQNGVSNLYQPGKEPELIEELAKYFKTDRNGTISDNMCKGLEAFLNAKGYKAKLTYQGFRPVDAKYKTASLPDLNRIKKDIDKHNAVLLNIGVYKKNIQDGKTVYTRHYGHFVTAVGGNSNGLSVHPDYLAIRDPYSRIKGNHYIKLSQIQEGKLIHNPDDNEISLTDNAAGFYELSPKFNYFAPDEVGIINGVVSLEVEK